MSLRREWLRTNEKSYKHIVDYTKSTHFIMPMVDYEIADFLSSDEKVNHLINCYIDVEGQRIVIVLDNVNDNAILSILKFTETNPYFINSIIDDDDKEIVLFFNIPLKYKEDFDIFLTSKYSKMTENYKSKLVDVYGRQTNTRDWKPNQFDVIYPTTYKRNHIAKHYDVDPSLIGEFTSALNMDYESYKSVKDLLQVSILSNNKQQKESSECENQ